MMNKQECRKALDSLRILERKDNFLKWGGQVAPQINCDVIEQLIKEHFELVEWKKRFDDLSKLTGYELHVLNVIYSYQLTTEKCNNCTLKLVADIPYKLEDLKPNMWVWDNVEQRVIKIIETKLDCFNRRIIIFFSNYMNSAEFEENRFFPVQKANEVFE